MIISVHPFMVREVTLKAMTNMLENDSPKKLLRESIHFNLITINN